MRSTAAASGFVVFLLSVQVVQGQNGWGVSYNSTEVCAPKGSSVELRCTYTHPYTRNGRVVTVVETFWYVKTTGYEPVDLNTDVEYAGRVQHSCTEKSCTLRITDLRERDSAVYKFRFITNQPGGRYSGWKGVTLTVTALQVQKTSSSHRSWTTLSCHNDCSLTGSPSYIWYKNGQKTQTQSYYYSDSIRPEDIFACAMTEHEDFPSAPVCATGQRCNRVTYTHRSICAFKGSSVDISSSYSSHGSITSKFWFRSERRHQWSYQSQPEDLRGDPQYEGRVQVHETKTGLSTLRITKLTDTDSAQYHFRFTAGSFEWRSSLPGTTLTVTALQVQVIRATDRQQYIDAELRCHSSCSPEGPLSYVWFRNGQRIMAEETSSYKVNIYPGDSISCAFKGHEDYRSPSVYAPRRPSVSVSPSEIMAGSSVNVTCSSDANPAATYTWYKENLKHGGREVQLSFSSIQSSDSGEYYCTAENELGRMTSERISIDVRYAPKLPSVSVSPSAEIMEGSSVNVTCSSDANPAANYTWYKENQTLPVRSTGVHLFTSIHSADSGTYYCTSENKYGLINSTSVHIDVQYAPRPPSVSVSPSAEIMEGSSVNVTCSSDANPAANYTWYKEGKDSAAASGHIFTITAFTADQSGNYYCEAWNKVGRHNNTIHLMSVSGSMYLVAAGSITASFLAVIFLLVFILIRRKMSLKQTSREPGERPGHEAPLDGSSVRAQNKPAETEDDLCYTSVKFCKNPEDPLYSNICVPQPSMHINEEEYEDGVEYSVVHFPAANSRCQEAVEDSTALYSTVTKKVL